MEWKLPVQIKDVVTSKDDLINQLLKNRGLKTKEQQKKFFDCNISDFEEELLIPGIEKAKKRILQAIKDQEQIIVFGDYDVDGVCATAIIYHTLSSLGAKILPYIPHREKEGYGLSIYGIDQARDQGAKLIITVDNGIVAEEAALYAKKIGIDLIISDHHLPGSSLPKAHAVVHSTKMAGAGVAWALARRLSDDKDFVESLLDLVAVATVCDLVPLVDINRALVKKGLEILNRTERVGFLALFAKTNLNLGSINTYHIGYILGPRLNAIGRLEHAMDALRLLCTSNPEKAYNLATKLCDTNDQKKKITEKAIWDAKSIIDGLNLKGQKVIFLSSKDWIPGVIGLVAGRLAEEYHLPAIIISEGEIESKGSARSVDGINIVETIRVFSDLLIDLGGHPKAAGFTLKSEKITDLKSSLTKAFDTVSYESNSSQEVEAILSLDSIDLSWIEAISIFEPFGMGNPKPLFGSIKEEISNVKTVGNGKHLRAKIAGVQAIAFSKGDKAKILDERQIVDLMYYLEIDNFTGEDKLQLKVINLE